MERATVSILVLAVFMSAGCARGEAENGTPSASPTVATSAESASPNRLPEGRAGDVIRRSIDFHGGWSTWVDARTVAYEKSTILFDSLGHEIRRIVQDHRYMLHPLLKMRITYEDEGRDILIINDGEQARKWIDGEPATSQDDRDHAWNTTFGSHYVFSMPFKLADPGAILTYAGRDTLDGTPVEKIQVDYEEGAGSAGGMHTWTYYFDVDDGRLVANHLRYGPGAGDYDLTEYHEYHEIDGLRLPTRRTSYHSNAAADKLAKASAYVNRDVRFGLALPDSLFGLER